MRLSQGLRVILLILLYSLGGGCGGGNYKDPATPDGKLAVLEDANRYLSTGNCDAAIEAIKPVYESADTDTKIRMMMASAYVCKSNLNFFGLIMDLLSNSAVLGINAGKTGFFSLMAKLFPATNAPQDKAMEGGLLAQDALMSVLRPGAVVLPQSLLFSNTHNPASTNYTDRTDESNTFMFFVTMATMGAIESEFFPIDRSALYVLTGALPWTVATAIDTDACAYAATIMNFSDSVASLQATVTGPLKEVFTQVGPVVTALEAACKAGCNTPLISVACNTGCTSCPLTLRDRYSCTKVDGDPASCAAASVIKSVESLWGPVP